jgi:pimeloyl-ACP methyl ester carboxylesterase
MTFVPELKPFRLISADNPGCGDSSYDEKHPLNIDGVVELVENFVEQLKLTRFLLVGGSMGGLVALLYAEQNPDKIAGFVNVEGNLAPEDCMFSRNVIPHSYSRFESIVFRQIKKALSAKEGRGFARHLQVLGQANPRAYYDYSFQTVESSFAVWPRTFSNHRIPTIRLEPRLFRSSWYEDFVAVLPRDHL